MAARLVKNAAIVTRGRGRAGKDDYSAVMSVTMACHPRWRWGARVLFRPDEKDAHIHHIRLRQAGLE